MESKYFSKNAIKGLTRIGDILIPGDETFPSFAAYGCMEHIDDVLAYAPAEDIKDLNMVLGILSLFPHAMLVWLVRKMASSHQSDGPMSSLLRQLNMGIRGVVFSLYYSEKPGHTYSGENPSEMIGFKLNKVWE